VQSHCERKDERYDNDDVQNLGDLVDQHHIHLRLSFDNKCNEDVGAYTCGDHRSELEGKPHLIHSICRGGDSVVDYEIGQ